ncbi:MAG: hypothetical protein NDJ89_10120 [Oligoflexia bacterium]|nr:hypothetical protein [Oligoflexia bacterium]
MALLWTALPCDAAILAEKLARQWERYEAAQELLVRRAVAERPFLENPVSRQEWESLLALDGELAFTESDLRELRSRQRARIEAARAKALRESVIDLAAIRTRGEVSRFCERLPKGAMLHVHPSGTLNRVTAESLVRRNDPLLEIPELIADTEGGLYPDEEAWLGALGGQARFSALSAGDQERFLSFFFLPPGTHPFTRFDAVFSFIGFAADDAEDRFQIFRDFAERAVREGVSYVEFTTGVRKESLPQFELIAQRLEAELGLVVRFNSSFSRRSPPDKHAKQVESLLELQSPFLVGIDLLGNETEAPALETAQLAYGTVLSAVRSGRSRLHRTQHAGELGDPRNPRDALLLGAERLGHGVKLEDDPVTLEYAALRATPIEINLISNLRLRAVEDMRNHPFLRYLRLGLPVSLSTDDEGIFESDINRECETAITSSDVTYAELKRMALNSIDTSFAESTDKARLREKVLEQFRRFESEYAASARN